MTKRTTTGTTPGTLIGENHILFDLTVDNKIQGLRELAKLAAPVTGLSEHVIFDVLFAREKLGTTGVGHGIAIPHGKIENTDKVYGFFARLSQPIDFEAIDEKPVDLLFMLLAPHDAGADHLKALAKVSRMFRQKEFCEKLRAAKDNKALYALLSEGEEDVEAPL
ncbi:MAG: PTS IIA-like nitrogen-regulatory protein PtsN [Alphaproteobacteria bacterium]|nr:PTS IIA-like nitrogen-regulatory protein PtsN [Alphaproteobacteria bacterium]